ncbi:MAG TPA: hypothetical protein VEB86_00690 [Chryseosolibacter sp.]|nr:hypothetical protein [Chryseosolibacter sp.]
MYGFYTPFFLLQAFCVYHAYRHNYDYKWYFLILFFPGVGACIYLIHHFYNRQNVKSISEGLKVVVNSNYRIEQLEKTLKFSDTVANRINLADAYVQIGRYNEAADLYRQSLQGFMADDPALRMKLLYALFLKEDYRDCVALGDSLRQEKTFRGASERLAYAWALYYEGHPEKAEATFQDMDRSYTNYNQRLEYCKFLVKTGRKAEAKEKLADLLGEFEHMKGPERRLYRALIAEVRDMHANVAVG